MLVTLLLSALIVGPSSALPCPWSASVVAPSMAVPGRTTPVLVTLQEHRDAVKVTLRLLEGYNTGEQQRILVENTTVLIGQGMLPLFIPSQASGEATLQTIISCPDDGYNRSTQTDSLLRLVGSVRDVIIRPISKYYRPGETVEFWVLALDHDLRMASSTSGFITVQDPRGTNVAAWHEIPLDEGVKHFSLPLSPLATEGEWKITVTVESRTFLSVLNISHARGSTDALTPELAIAEEHFVELRFSQEMRRRYKPGLPFVGKVEAVSSEQAVRVRVKVLDNLTSIYSQDIEMSRGEGTFLVPAILSDSDVITLQAELVSVAGKETDSHYVLAREPLLKWNSTSACYLLIEGIEKTLQPNDDAHAVILSSCPCDRTLHYVITTEGHVTHWNQTDSMTEDQVPPPVSVDGAAICRINFTFKVEAVMAPVSHLLVYYITHDGEAISDVISFDVNLLQREGSVNLERRTTWYPGENIDVEVLADLGTLVCLVGGRGGEARSQHRFVSESMDFTEAGLVFLQQFCSVQQNITSCKISDPQSKDIPVIHRSIMSHTNLEQIWFWRCFNYTPEVEATGLIVPAPLQPGKWSLSALLLPPTPSPGLRLSPPVTFNVFQPITVEFRLASNIIVGEALEVDVKIGNNVNSCVDVNGLLSLSEGAHFTGVNQPLVAEKLRLGPQGATSLVVRIVATSPGIKNMTVQVSAVMSENCQSVHNDAARQGNNSLVGTVMRSGTVLVHGEGLQRKHTESAYFCANEQIVISTESSFQYEYLPAPRNRQNIVFEVRSGKSVHLAISDVQGISTQTYVVVLGGLGNRISWITRGKHGYGTHLASWPTPGVLSEENTRTFWLSWELGALSIGHGALPHFNLVLKYKIDPKMKVYFLGFTTEWGENADFRIWNYNDEAGFSQVLHLDVPRYVLPGSESGTLIINGGLSLLSIDRALPRSPTIHTSLSNTISQIAPLLESNNITSNESIKMLKQHIQNLMAFKINDNSFGDHHNISSHWNTLHALEILHYAQMYIGIDAELISSIIKWVKNRQNRDGSFTPSSIDFGINNTTESNIIIQTTAETLATLLKVGIESEDDAEVILKARFYLESCLYHDLDYISLAMLNYALVLTKSVMLPQALDRLRNTSTNEEGDFGWPHPSDNADWLYEEGAGQIKPPVASNVNDYKASLYVLMTYSLLPDMKSAEPVVRYLFYRSHVLDKHTELIYTAMKAFSMYASWGEDKHRQLTLSLATSGMELTDTLELRNSTTSQVLHLPSLPTKVFVYATGAGCATVQGHVSYATYSPTKSNNILDIWAGVEQETLPPRNSAQESIYLDIKVCIRWKGVNESSVLRTEVNLFSGFQLFSVNQEDIDDMVQYGSHDNKVWFILTNIRTKCIRLSACSVFTVSGLRPALATVYPTSSPNLAVQTFFHTRRASPLLADTTDDDFITWFGSDYNDDNLSWKDTISSQKHPKKDDDMIPDMIVLSDLNEDPTFINDITSPDTSFNQTVPNNTESTTSIDLSHFNEIDSDVLNIDDDIESHDNDNNKKSSVATNNINLMISNTSGNNSVTTDLSITTEVNHDDKNIKNKVTTSNTNVKIITTNMTPISSDNTDVKITASPEITTKFITSSNSDNSRNNINNTTANSNVNNNYLHITSVTKPVTNKNKHVTLNNNNMNELIKNSSVSSTSASSYTQTSYSTQNYNKISTLPPKSLNQDKSSNKENIDLITTTEHQLEQFPESSADNPVKTTERFLVLDRQALLGILRSDDNKKQSSSVSTG